MKPLPSQTSSESNHYGCKPDSNHAPRDSNPFLPKPAPNQPRPEAATPRSKSSQKATAMIRKTLLSLLTEGFERAYTPADRAPASSTKSIHYNHEDVTHEGHWPDFSPELVRQKYHAILTEERPSLTKSSTIRMSPQTDDPLKLIESEWAFSHYAARTIYQDLNRAFDAVPWGKNRRLQDRVENVADRLGVEYNSLTNEARSTLVGELKLSWVFNSAFDSITRRQPLSQLLYYLHQSDLKYGYILTDKEFVAVQRDSKDIYGSLLCSDPVPWGPNTMLVLWGLHMEAAAHPGLLGIDRPHRSPRDAPDYDSSWVV